MTYHVFFNMKSAVSMEELEAHGEAIPDAPKESEQFEQCGPEGQQQLSCTNANTGIFYESYFFIYWHTYRIF